MDKKQVKKVIEDMNKLHAQQDTKAWIERQGNIKWMIQRADEMRAEREDKARAGCQVSQQVLDERGK